MGIGGPGATFWMILAGLLGMASKFTECTLGVKYRNEYEDGTVSGGPMYYIEKGLGSRWKWLAVAFAVCAVISSFGSGNSIQAFTVADQIRADLGVPTWITGLVTAGLVAAVILGGASLLGGSGTIFKTVIGVLILGFIQNGLLLAGLEFYVQFVVTWIIIILAVWLDIAAKRGKLWSPIA